MHTIGLEEQSLVKAHLAVAHVLKDFTFKSHESARGSLSSSSSFMSWQIQPFSTNTLYLWRCWWVWAGGRGVAGRGGGGDAGPGTGSCPALIGSISDSDFSDFIDHRKPKEGGGVKGQI